MTGAWDAAKKAATEGFDWQNLLPSWMIGAWESSKGLASQIGGFDWRSLLPQFIQDLFPGLDGKQLTIKDGLTFDWRSLLPQFIQDLFPSATGQPLTIAKGLESVGAFAWTSLLPKFIQNLIEGKPIADADKGFDWKDLLPQFIRDFLGDEKVEVVGGLYAGWWKSLLPNFITNWIDGKPIFGETEEDGSLQSGWWKSLLPNWAKNIVEGKSPFATMTEGLEDGWWKKLLPTWAVNIIDGKSPFENVLPSISSIETELKNFSKKIYDPETGTVFGFTLPTLPSIADIKTKIDDFGKKIYDPATNQVFGFVLPTLPSIADIKTKIDDFGKKIYDSEKETIFGIKLPELPTFAGITETVDNFGKKISDFFSDLFNFDKIIKFVKSMLPSFLFGGEEETTETPKTKSQTEELKPLDSSSLIDSLLGDVDLGKELIGMFKSVIDDIVKIIPGGETVKGVVDFFTGEDDPEAEKKKLEEERLEKVKEIEQELKNELSKPMEGGLFTDIQDPDKIKSLQAELALLNVKPLAKGGILPKGKVGLVGEAGPELITSSQESQQVINSNQTNTILEKLVRTTTARTQMIEQNSKNMSSSAPVFINNVDNSVRSNGGGGGTIPIPKPVNNPNTDLLAAVAAVF
jgi:hypothetical protein